MAYPQGINFRATLAFVTDGASEAFEITSGVVNYPHTSAQGNNIGWETVNLLDVRDRNSGVDVRLAGINFLPNPGTSDYRLDLSATGNWDINLAAGDYTYAQGPIKIEVFDTAASLGVLVNGTTSGGQRWFDAKGTELDATTWPSSNVAQNVTFATTICRVRVGGAASLSSVIAHVKLTSAAAPVTAPLMAQIWM